jgi:uncharacterized glyoxalase superfamily protein PhnB
MSTKDKEAEGSIVPTLRYRDVGAAIDWLCNAFGFERHLVVDDADGEARYAELTFGTGMVMVGPAEDEGADAAAQEAASGRPETQVCYLFVPDAASHCAHAKAAGAEIILDIHDEESRGRGYSCRDPEGHVWTFGTYDPWKRTKRQAAPEPPAYDPRLGGRRLALAAAILGVIITSAVVAGWVLGFAEFHGFDARASVSVAVDADAEPSPEMRELRERLAREQASREAAERAVAEAHTQLARERSARDGTRAGQAAAERALEEARGQLVRERNALAAAQRMAEEARTRLSLAEHSAHAAAEQLAAERSAREAADLARQQAVEQLAKERAAQPARQERTEKQPRSKARPSVKGTVHDPHAPRAMAAERDRVFRPYAKWDI